MPNSRRTIGLGRCGVAALVLCAPLLLGARHVVETPPPRDRVQHQLSTAAELSWRIPESPLAATPTAIATGDFDGDGLRDLLCGHALSGADGAISIHRGQSSPRFLSPDRFVGVPVPPDMLASGDFDGDGRLDAIVAAENGGSLFLLRGGGRGRLEAPVAIELAGEITALVAGELGRPDGYADLAVAIVGANGPAVLVFSGPSGAFSDAPRAVPVLAVVTALALGRLNPHPAKDLVAAAGTELLLIGGEHGSAEVRRSFADPIEALAIADTVWEEDHREELSVLTMSGDLFTFALVPQGSPSATRERLAPVAKFGRHPSSERPRRIVPLRATGQPAEELLLLDGEPGLKVIAHRRTTDVLLRDPVEAVLFDGPSFDDTILAAVPLRLNADTLSDLVLIGAGGSLRTLLSAPSAIFTVDSPGDASDFPRGDGVCDTGAGSCTLRAAIQEANAFPGADTIAFDLPADSLTIRPTVSLPIVSEVVTIDATTQIGYAGVPLVSLDGGLTGSSTNGLFLTGGGIAVRGLSVGGFGSDGIVVAGNGSDVLEGNFIGVETDGVTARPNGIMGVTVSSGANTIGGTIPSAANVISGNGVYGVWFDSALAVDNDLVGNLIGTDASGTTALGNGFGGVTFTGGSLNRIGTPDPGGGNVISGNAAGVFMQSGSGGMNLVQGNRIGTQADGMSDLGNGGTGVTLSGSGDTVGGAAGNTVAFNTGAGVRVLGASATGNRISGNSVFSNGGLGIDLGPAGVTPNDPADPDVGENDLQNYPELDRIDSRDGLLTIEGRMDGPPSSEVAIEFFSDSLCDPSGYGEGRMPLGATAVTTDTGGLAAFSASLAASVLPGETVTATATNPNGSTSEFSECVAASACSLELFGQTIVAPDESSLSWPVAADVIWVKGDLAAVDLYDVLASAALGAATGLDISADSPNAGSGLYYLVRPPGGCGSWQTVAGGEPGRDAALP